MPQISPPKLYLNENVAIRLVLLLKEFGIEAIHTLDVGNQGQTDEFQLQYAANRNYILVTHNRKDFRQLHNHWLREGKSHSGILVMRYNEPEQLADRIKRFLEVRYATIVVPFCESPPA
jgi:predicted nuclease of predicted toxin-antitoxin system